MLPIIILVAGLSNLVMGIVVAAGSKETKGKISFVVFSFITFVWGAFVFLIYESDFPITVKLAYSFGALTMAALLEWAYHYTTANYRKWRSVLVYIIGTVFAILPFAGSLMIEGIDKNPSGGFDEKDGLLFPLYAAYIMAVYILVVVTLIRSFRSSSGDRRHQTKLIMYGISLFIGSSILFVFVLPAFGYEQLMDFDVPLSMIFVAFTTYAIVKYQWMRIKIVAFELLSIFIIGASLMEIFLAGTSGQRLYKSIMFVVLTVLSVFMVKSVLAEVKRKEELQRMADSLSDANEKLRKLDQARTDFINIASHQLKKVPTPIKGYLSLLLDGTYGEVPEKQRPVLKKIYAGNERQISLVDDLLNVARMESGKFKLDLQRNHLEKICREVYDTLLPNAKDKGLNLSYEESKEALPELILDKGKIFEAIFNFVDNAIKYTPQGEVGLEIELASESHYEQRKGDDEAKGPISGPVARVTVSDTGMGIAKEDIPALFAKFSRRDASHMNSEGTGLGLYVVKLVIEAHGGRTWAESPGKGKGSKFIMEFPTKTQTIEIN